MSAIYGAIDFNGRYITDKEIECLKKPFERCKIDRYSDNHEGNVYMGCGLQYVTRESHMEKLPYCDNEIFFDADLILDNREDIALRLGIDTDKIKDIPDAELTFRYIKSKGVDGLNDLLGAYAFIYYDRNSNKLIMPIDAVGNRCIYYRVIGNTFYYSSLMESLENLERTTKNGRWISDFLAMDSLVMINELFETPKKEIFRVGPAHYVSFDGKNAKQVRYWDCLRDNSQNLVIKTDDEYKEEFRKIFFDAVRCVLRSDNKTSILLSGGYDSTAVAAVASKELANRGEELFSYTSVPLKGLNTQSLNNAAVDETEAVLKTQKIYTNINCRFMDLEDKNPWKDRKLVFDDIEFPYKSIPNTMWIREAFVNSRDIGAKVMLMGEFGNTTISYGNYRLYVYELFKKGHFIKILTQTRAFCHKNGYSTKYFLKCFIKDLINKHTIDMDKLSKSIYLSNTAIKKYSVYERLSSLYEKFDKAERSYKLERSVTNELLALRQIGEINTKLSLETGVIVRDPAKDKRVLEFCLKAPIELFQHGFEWRRLCSIYLKDIMPEHVLNCSFKGIQSADFKSRIAVNWDGFIKDCKELVKKAHNNNELIEIVDLSKIEKDLDNWDDSNKLGTFDVNRMIYTMLIIEYYLKK